MNKTKIDWCDSTWNPVTGCYHNCEYCYARKQVKRFEGWYYSPGMCRINVSDDKTFICPQKAYYGEVKETKLGKIADINDSFLTKKVIKAPYPFGFTPTFHRYRLDDYKSKSGRNIFVCSMADLFGDWVPDEWIEEVFKACGKADQHRYLFLTKNPSRYCRVYRSELDYRINHWFGVTVNDDASFMIKGQELFESTGGMQRRHANRFLSIEPILGKIKNVSLQNIGYVDWVIIGAETGNRKGKVIPKREWIENIVLHCRMNGTPIFMKESLRELMGEEFIQEFPWRSDERTSHA